MRVSANRWMVGASIPLLAAGRAWGDDQVGIAHETYVEDHNRMLVNTEALRVKLTLSPWLDVTGRGVYDAISGATPTGAPAIKQLKMRSPIGNAPIPNSAITGYKSSVDAVSGASPSTAATTSHSAIPLAESRDTRKGGDIDFGLTFGPSRLTPQIGFSQESDYISWAGGLNYSLELNDKNTILSAGWNHAYDQILPNQFSYLTSRQTKNTDEYMLGGTQLLSPTTVVSLSGTLGHAHGYLNDPYRSVVFDQSGVDANGYVPLQGEKRPSNRDSQAVFLSATQAITPLRASIEATYRYYHDSYGIGANTLGLQWFQKIGPWVIAAPSVRYYRQNAANFYAIQFPGDPNFDAASVTAFYSSDYRLSAFETYTIGIDTTFHLGEKFDLQAGYHRYWMHGLDHQTLQSTYPAANIFSAGLTYKF